VTSRKNNGTTFHVELPVVAGAAAEEKKSKVTAAGI
jgi:hypothetical protein